MNFWRFFINNYARLMSIIGAGSLAFLGVMGFNNPAQFFSSWTGRGAVAAVIVFLIGEIIDWVQAARVQRELRGVNQLKEKNTELKSRLLNRENALYELVKRLLWIIALRLENNDQDRISLYKRRPDGSFRLVGRYSQHQEYTEYTRDGIPAHEGIVAKAWASQNEELVDISSDPAVDFDAYALEQRTKCGIQVETTRAFRMRSREYMAFPVKDRDGAPGSPGVIVFESTVAGRFSRDVTQRGRVRSAVDLAAAYLQLCTAASDATWQRDTE